MVGCWVRSSWIRASQLHTKIYCTLYVYLLDTPFNPYLLFSSAYIHWTAAAAHLSLLKKKNREKKSWIFSIVKYKREGEAASSWTGRIQRTYNSLSLLLLVGPCSFELLKSLWSLVSSNQSAVPVSSIHYRRLQLSFDPHYHQIPKEEDKIEYIRTKKKREATRLIL